jgi:hypothetical protein
MTRKSPKNPAGPCSEGVRGRWANFADHSRTPSVEPHARYLFSANLAWLRAAGFQTCGTADLEVRATLNRYEPEARLYTSTTSSLHHSMTDFVTDLIDQPRRRPYIARLL